MPAESTSRSVKSHRTLRKLLPPALTAISCLLLSATLSILGGCQTPRGGIAESGETKKVILCLPDSATPGQSLAASELALHLRTVFSIDAPIVHIANPTEFDDTMFPLYIGFLPPGVSAPPPGHGGYLIDEHVGYFYGSDQLTDEKTTSSVARALNPNSHPATAFAVYQYLEKHCDIHWPSPRTIAQPPRTEPGMPKATGVYTPRNTPGQWMEASMDKANDSGLDTTVRQALRVDSVTTGVRQLYVNLWLKRLRLGLANDQKHDEQILHAWCPGAAKNVYRDLAESNDVRDKNLLLRHDLIDWGLTGLMRYTLARGLGTGFTDNFDVPANEYFKSFGPAQADIKNYFNAWTTICQDMTDSFPTSDLAFLPELMSPERLSGLAIHLDRAITKDNLTDPVIRELDHLLMGHEQTALMLDTHETLKSAEINSLTSALEQIRQLVVIRSNLKSNVFIDFVRLTEAEIDAADLTGLRFMTLASGLVPKYKVQDWKFNQNFSPVQNENGAVDVSLEALKSWNRLDSDRSPAANPNEEMWCATVIENPTVTSLQNKTFLILWGVDEGIRVYLDGLELSPSAPIKGSAKFAIPAKTIAEREHHALLLQTPSGTRIVPCRGAWLMVNEE